MIADRARRCSLSRPIGLLAAAAALMAGGQVFAQAGADPANKDGWVAIIDGSEVPVPDIKMGDRDTILKIIDEGKNRNQVMQHLEHLTKKIGHRLTGGSNTERANHWCADMYRSWGLTNIQVEEWGTIPVRFDRGPSTGRVVVANN